jgi:hypothetical protein
MDLKPRRRVIVSETVPVPQQTVRSLIATITNLFEAKDRPIRMLYRKGKDIEIEVARLVDDTDEVQLDSGLLTPFQVVRQHCELDLIEHDVSGPLLTLCRMMAEARKRAPIISGVVVSSETILVDWLGTLSIPEIFGVPVYVDPEAPKGMVFICSSSTGTMIRDFEQAVACSVQEV